jgi:hypothetical protein
MRDFYPNERAPQTEIEQRVRELRDKVNDGTVPDPHWEAWNLIRFLKNQLDQRCLFSHFATCDHLSHHDHEMLAQIAGEMRDELNYLNGVDDEIHDGCAD